MRIMAQYLAPETGPKRYAAMVCNIAGWMACCQYLLPASILMRRPGPIEDMTTLRLLCSQAGPTTIIIST